MKRLRYLLLAILLLLIPRTVQSQESTIIQTGLEHTLAKSAYSLAVYGVMRELGANKPTSLIVSTAGLWAAGWFVQSRRGHSISKVDKLHDLAAHTLFVVPLVTRSKPKTSAISFSVSLSVIALTCRKANPMSC